jgi:acid phosphatase
MMPKVWISVLWVMICVLAGCGHQELTNLSLAKQRVQEYYESGKFDQEVNQVIENAKAQFAKVHFKQNSVVIFDVDETALNNYGFAKTMGFGYVYDLHKKWTSDAQAPAMSQVKALYDDLLARGAKIVFLTGRASSEYDATAKNLKSAGYTTYEALMTRPSGEKKSALEFKSASRVTLTAKGYEIMGTVGDQMSDLEGPYHGIQIKIPNYLYVIP